MRSTEPSPARIGRPASPGTGRAMHDLGRSPYKRFVGLLSENIYVMEHEDGLVMVDAGVPGGFRFLSGRLERSGSDPGRIGHLLLTHFHFDHAGAASAIKACSGATVYALDDEVPFLQKEKYISSIYSRGVLGRATGRLPGAVKLADGAPRVEVDHRCADGELLPLLGGVLVLAGPGHTPGSAVYYLRERGILFSGDVIINTYRFLTRPTSGYSADYSRAARSICRIADRLAGAELTAICPGHGPVVEEDPMGKLMRLRKSLERRVPPEP